MATFSDAPIRGRDHIKLFRTKVIGKKLSRLDRETRSFEAKHGGFSSFGLGGVTELEPVVRSLALELGRVKDQERKKIADQLHDQIGQNLVLAKMKLQALKSLATGEPADLIETILDLIDRSIKDTRLLIHELDVEWLAELNPKEALDWLVEQLQAKYNLRCVTDILSLPKSLEKGVQAVLLQAVRELLVNVAKHAGVNQASMACESEKDWIRIHVVDKGRGFDLLPSRSRKVERGGFGLTIVRARLGHLGGNLHIDSHIGMGTRATIVLPYR